MKQTSAIAARPTGRDPDSKTGLEPSPRCYDPQPDLCPGRPPGDVLLADQGHLSQLTSLRESSSSSASGTPPGSDPGRYGRCPHGVAAGTSGSSLVFLGPVMQAGRGPARAATAFRLRLSGQGNGAVTRASEGGLRPGRGRRSPGAPLFSGSGGHRPHSRWRARRRRRRASPWTRRAQCRLRWTRR